MIPIEQTPNTELCERLHECGFPFGWLCWEYVLAGKSGGGGGGGWHVRAYNPNTTSAKYPAPTVPELLAMLPVNSIVERCAGHYEALQDPMKCERFGVEEGDTAADALARLWLQLQAAKATA